MMTVRPEARSVAEGGTAADALSIHSPSAPRDVFFALLVSLFY